jgi:hypothetical protein
MTIERRQQLQIPIVLMRGLARLIDDHNHRTTQLDWTIAHIHIIKRGEDYFRRELSTTSVALGNFADYFRPELSTTALALGNFAVYAGYSSGQHG